MSESKLKGIIQNYLSEAELKETLHDPKLELGFRFVFPKGKNPQGKPFGRPFTIIKAKVKDILEFTSPVVIAPEHVKIFQSKEQTEVNSFFRRLMKKFVLQGLFFNIDIKNYRYAIIDNIFLNKGKVISKNIFYTSIRKVLGCALYSIFEVQDFCKGDFDASDLKLL